MSRRRFFVSRDRIRDGIALLPEDQAHHLKNVLRLKAGDEVELIDGEGAAYVGKVDLQAGGICIRDLLEKGEDEKLPMKLSLAPALIKSDKLEWILQKATELGVHEIVLLETRHCDVRIPANRLEARLERWRRIVRESAKQCRRLSVPRVHLPMAFRDFLSLERYAPHNRLLLYERTAAPWDINSLRAGPTVLCVGPEGGWHESEIAAAQGAGFRTFSLGPRILRAETAALVAVTMIQYGIGNYRNSP